MTRRVAVAGVVAVLTGCYVAFVAWRQPDFISDFDQLWFAARAMRDGCDPYAVIGPGRAVDLPFPLYYPLTAVILAWPLSWLPLLVARVLWVAVPSGMLCWLVTREDYSQLPMFASGAFLSSALNAQWTPLLMCAMYLPAIGGVVAGKPNIGASAIGGMQNLRDIEIAGLGALGLLFVSLLIAPGWPFEWLATVRSADHFLPYILRPLGVLLLFAMLRWRNPAARVLLAIAVVPHTAAVYEGLWAFTAARTFRQSLILALLTHAANFWAAGAQGDFPHYVSVSALATLTLCYLPMLWLVLRRSVDEEVFHVDRPRDRGKGLEVEANAVDRVRPEV